MTREEAKAILKTFMENPLFSDIPKVCRAFDMAIKALEQQPCEDCISRQRVLDIINFEYKWLLDAKVYDICTSIAFSAIMSKISEMPSVTLRTNLAETSQDCISREEAKQFLYERIDRLNDDELYDIFSRIIDDMYNDLSPVTPQPMAESEE